MNRVNRTRFYDDKNNVRDYVEMRKGMDGRIPIKILKSHLERESSVLELGMGPGADLIILNETFEATGSDSSQAFIESFRKSHPGADLLLLDAATVKTSRRFDCIYSNKVLHHLGKAQMQESIARQKSLLNRGGIIFHTFWKGTGRSSYQDLHFIKYELSELNDIFARDYEVVDDGYYTEMNTNDSIFIIGRRKS